MAEIDNEKDEESLTNKMKNKNNKKLQILNGDLINIKDIENYI